MKHFPYVRFSLFLLAVFLFASSTHRFSGTKKAIGSTQRAFPHQKIILYDIGLNQYEAAEAQLFCDVEYRAFNFSKYDDYLKPLREYRWKPIVMAVRKYLISLCLQQH